MVGVLWLNIRGMRNNVIIVPKYFIYIFELISFDSLIMGLTNLKQMTITTMSRTGTPNIVEESTMLKDDKKNSSKINLFDCSIMAFDGDLKHDSKI